MSSLPHSLCRRTRTGTRLTVLDHHHEVARTLTITPDWPLYFRSLGQVETTTKGLQRTFHLVNGGVYEFGNGRIVYLQAVGGGVRVVSELEALRLLGAEDYLLDWGLDDAVVSLAMGDLTNARCQLLRAREAAQLS